MSVELKLKSGNVPIDPILKWAGGKRWLVPHLEPLWADHRHMRLVEPFCGGLAVSLGLRPEKALLNDINPHLINFYRWVKEGLVVTIEMANDQELYYLHRDRFNELIASGQSDSKEAAELLYYLNRTCYNGLYRVNSDGLFNVPFGKYKNIKYVRDFTYYKDVFKEWQFYCADFETLELHDDDFVYADPPYDVEFTKYAKDDFKWEDQVRLAEWLAEHPGPVILSNQATERIVKLYGDLGFDVRLLKAPRRIACNGDRTPAMEVLATRNI
ncbi:MAG TPA: Dam family site-specific DNA-(adenine-N6)-methyltransferase [Limnochordia bacterium]|jgi:DNA adenine methylase|nr:Dam family site-specific DNA-(adenine-N6)-methyltransferase [Limnochordia bacterium]